MLQGIIKYGMYSTTQFFEMRAATFSISSDLTTRDVDGFPFNGDGIIQIVDSEPQREIYTLQLDTESFDLPELARVIGQQQATTSDTLSLPVPITGTVAAGNVTVSGLVADESVRGGIARDTGNVQLVQSTSAPDATEFQITADTVVVDTSYNGDVFNGVRFVDQTSFVSIGREAGLALNELAFFGELVGPRLSGTKIYIPRASRSSGITVGVGANAGTNSTQYRLKASSGFSLPFMLWQ